MTHTLQLLQLLSRYHQRKHSLVHVLAVIVNLPIKQRQLPWTSLILHLRIPLEDHMSVFMGPISTSTPDAQLHSNLKSITSSPLSTLPPALQLESGLKCLKPWSMGTTTSTKRATMVLVTPYPSLLSGNLVQYSSKLAPLRADTTTSKVEQATHQPSITISKYQSPAQPLTSNKLHSFSAAGTTTSSSNTPQPLTEPSSPSSSSVPTKLSPKHSQSTKMQPHQSL